MLPFTELSQQARKADVLPGLRPNTLISVGKLADADYTTIFHPQGEGVTVHKKGSVKITQWQKPVLQGWRDASGLWRLSQKEEQKKSSMQTKKKDEAAANVYSLPSITQTIKYLHAATGFPTKDSWIKAIKNGNYRTWPGLTVENVKKHFPHSIETHKGHMKKQWQNVRSTKQVVEVPSEDEELTRSVTKQSLVVFNAADTVYTDQTGKFPVQSSRGNTSIMVIYDIDANAIKAEPIRSHHDRQMIPAYRELWKRINRG